MKKFLKAAAVAGGGIILAKGLDNRLEVTYRTVSSPKIPAGFNGFKIAQISDIHSDKIAGLVPGIRRERPDIIVSTGDIVHHKGGYECAVRLCGELLDIAPVYIVSGNHDEWRGDYSELDKEMTSLGAEPLHNTSVTLERNGDKIGLSGIDDPFSVISRQIKEFLDKAMDGITLYDGYNILLFHRANWIDYFSDFDFDLIISGHMHGGQVRLPLLGGVMSPRSGWASGKPILFPKYSGGYYRNGETEIIVSRGLGNPMFVPRFFNRPELVIITLKSKES